MRIRSKLLVLIVLPTLAIYVVLLGFTLAYLQDRSRTEVAEGITQLASHYAARFDGSLREAARIADTTAGAVADEADLAERRIFALLRVMLQQSPLVYGACMAFEPGTLRTDSFLYAPYVHRMSSGIREMNITEAVYDWYRDPQYTWFRAPKAAGHGVWSDPYFDEGAGNILMATYSAPFYTDGAFRGVVTVDIDLPQLQANVGREIAEDLDFVILTGQGQFVYSPDPKRIMKQTIFDYAREYGRPDLEALGRTILGGKPGITRVSGWDTPEPQWVFYAPMASCGWVLAARVPERQALAEARVRMSIAGGAAAATLALIVGCIFYVSGLITRPIFILNAKVLEIAGGKLDARVDGVQSNDEVGQLGQSFNKMTADLQSHVERLADERAAREKMERDLSIARDIQRSLLPVRKPNLPGFEIAGWSRPADQTGGDYYDWQELPEGRLAISLADATGHGIGPALVTTVCRAYSRASFNSGDEVGTVLSRINKLLVEDLQGNRFVTFVVALVLPAEGRVQLLSAGHGPLFVYTKADGRVQELHANDIPFGITECDYGPPSQFPMAEGDMVVLITDGFFEWANPEGEQFGTARVAEVIRAASRGTAENMIAELHRAVLEFSRGTPQEDDLTAVIIRRTGTITAENESEVTL